MSFCALSHTKFLFLVLLITGLIIHKSNAATNISEPYAFCLDMDTAAPTSVYQNNINTTLSLFSLNSTNKTRLYNTTVGSGDNTIYGLFFCRLDLTDAACQNCVSLAITELTTRCPGTKDSIVWNIDKCIVRYSDLPFLGIMHDDPILSIYNTQNPIHIWNVTSNVTSFMNVLSKAMDDAAAEATGGSPNKKFGTQDATFSDNLTSLNTLYVLAECTTDISMSDCKRCLHILMGNFTELWNAMAGCTLVCPNCIIRYDTYPFYADAVTNLSRLPSSPVPVYAGNSTCLPFNDSIIKFAVPECNIGYESTSGIHSKFKERKREVLVGVITSAASALILVFGVIMLVFKNRSKEALKSDETIDIGNTESLKFHFSIIRSATSNFLEDQKLGEGGFGEVFKGKLESGVEIAVKRLSRSSRQGVTEFKTEVLLVAKLQHRNLVKLLGFCISKKEKLLVYEYMPNGSLDRFLHDSTKCATLDWDKRFKIISGIARGLLYLHEDSRLKIIHRDLKSSNVLLDKDMNAKISDFGMARLFGADETHGNTNKIAGTFGYMAPEYVITGNYSVKSDVYSFGIIVLEIVCGQRNKFVRLDEDGESQLQRAWRLWNEEIAIEFVDKAIGNAFSSEEVTKCIHIGLLCIQEDAARRPGMASVVAALSGDSIVLPMPTPPHFFISGVNGLDQPRVNQSGSKFSGTRNITVLDPR